MPIDAIPVRLRQQAAQRPDAPAYRVRRDDGVWTTTSWATFADEVWTAARALLALGFEPYQTVCILGYNRPEWVILDVAAMTAGGVPAGIYTTCSPEEVHYIVDHAEAPVVLVEDEHQLAKIRAVKDRLPHLEHVVVMRDADAPDDWAMTWEDFLARAEDTDDAAVEARLEGLAPDDTATLIYTSGTTGPPKGVMLTHLNLAHTANVARDLVQATDADRMISYLPLSHIAEQMFSVHGPITCGYAIAYAESLDTLLRDMQETRPTILFGVPRVWEKMHARLSQALGTATGVKAFLANWAMDVGRKVTAIRNRGERPGGFLAWQHQLADQLIYAKIKARLGLDEARFGISGAAPISADILEFFSGLDIVILEVYGQSEDCGPTTFNQLGRAKFGTVGPAIPGTDVRIADDGEILVKGPNVFKGYYKDPAATADALDDDGWLHSGDLGSFDTEGFLTITGRKKEIIITAGGKNIAPKNIEAAIKDLPMVSQAVVIGDRRKFLSALITLDPDAAAEQATALGVDVTDLPEHPSIRDALQRGIDQDVNPRFARVEHVRRFTVLPGDLTVDGGELTPTMKVKRRVVDEKYADAIEAMYADAT